jgi:hypothetical protein
MFGWLTRKWRWRAARLLAVLYALCLVAPAAAFTLGHPILPAQCLTGDLDGVGMIHLDQHGSRHHHHSDGSGDHDGQASKCCGLFGLNGIAPAIDFVVGRQPPVSHDPSLIANYLLGQDSDRIDRPPKSQLAL